jgi:hypothetical protein
VPDGGFSNFSISYPTPHTVRRNFTLYPFNVSLSIFTDPLLPGNASILPSAVEAVLNASAGDFRGFQVPLEAPEVRRIDMSDMARVSHVEVTSGSTWWSPRSHWRVSGFIFPYTSVILTSMTSSDLGGRCPTAATNCTPGFTWSPNGASSYT